MPIVLYGDKLWSSPYVHTCFVALKEKAIPFEVKIVSLGSGEHKKGEMTKALTGRVPTIDHDGFWLAESSAIVDYLEDAFPNAPRVLPADVKQRARARQILAWVRSDLMPIREERSTSTMFYASQRAKTPLSDAGRAAKEKLLRVAGELVLDAKANLFDAWSIADADLAFMLQRLVLNGDDVPTKLRDWANAQWSRPSIRAFVDHARPEYEPYE
jgi:glutathione S-transferase